MPFRTEAEISEIEIMVISAQVKFEEAIVGSSPDLARVSELRMAKFHKGVLEADALLELAVLRSLQGLDPDTKREVYIHRHTAGRLVLEEYLSQGGLSAQAQYLLGSRVSFHTNRLEAFGVPQDPFPGVFK